MVIDENESKPIYIQISEWIELQIIENYFSENEKVMSQYQLADQFNINPATAGKGLSLLLEENILYKKRGLGMFVQTGAKEKIITKRKKTVLVRQIREFVLEARFLGLTEAELIKKVKEEIKGGYEDGES